LKISLRKTTGGEPARKGSKSICQDEREDSETKQKAKEH
jgi:hypothetical protein